MTKEIEKVVKDYDDMLECCAWIGQYVLTAKDGGDLWCAMRNYPGASDFSATLRDVLTPYGNN